MLDYLNDNPNSPTCAEQEQDVQCCSECKREFPAGAVLFQRYFVSAKYPVLVCGQCYDADMAEEIKTEGLQSLITSLGIEVKLPASLSLRELFTGWRDIFSPKFHVQKINQ